MSKITKFDLHSRLFLDLHSQLKLRKSILFIIKNPALWPGSLIDIAYLTINNMAAFLFSLATYPTLLDRAHRSKYVANQYHRTRPTNAAHQKASSAQRLATCQTLAQDVHG